MNKHVKPTINEQNWLYTPQDYNWTHQTQAN